MNRFLGENSALASFGYAPDEAESRAADRMLLEADACIWREAPPRWPEKPIERASFGMQYVWDRSNAARRYFQDDMIGPTSTLALGHGALGHVHGRGFAIPAGGVQDYIDALREGAMPRMVHAPVDARFEMAFFATEQACRGDLSPARFARMFGVRLEDAFGRELRFLLAERLLAVRGKALAKPPRPDFQSAHLLAFLLRDVEALQAGLAALQSVDAGASAPEGPPRVGAHELTRLLETDPEAAREVHLEVGRGLDAATATQLATAGKRGWRIEVHGEQRRPLREYAYLGELPPSMLWTRLAIRAAQSARGEQRLVVPEPAASSAPVDR